MADTTLIREHMLVLGSDGGSVGTVDALDGGRLRLTRDGGPEGHHHLPLAQVDRVDEDAVHLQLTAAEARAAMRDDTARDERGEA